jgi:hypothetical protein
MTQIPTIKQGDEGAKRRLMKAFDKLMEGDLTGWTHDQMVLWTAGQARLIATSRSRKDNPNGWSPLTRIMRLRVCVLGALYKRLEKGRCPGVCYKLYREVRYNIREVELSDEEEQWLGLPEPSAVLELVLEEVAVQPIVEELLLDLPEQGQRLD